MAAFALIGEGFALEKSLFDSDGLDGNSRAHEERSKETPCARSATPFASDGGLNESSGRKATGKRSRDGNVQRLKNRLTRQYGDEGRVRWQDGSRS